MQNVICKLSVVHCLMSVEKFKIIYVKGWA
jgi:hypothetical protein